MIEAKYLCFPIFGIFITPWSYISIVLKIFHSYLIPVKATCN